MVEHKVEQGSAEWHRLRLGKITSTRVDKVFKASNLDVVDEIIAERIAPQFDEDGYVSEEMQRGSDLEPDASDAYEAVTGIKMEAVGFITHDEYEWLACSPDRFTPDRTGGIEIKCPSTKKHVRYIRMGGVPNEHKRQVEQYFLINEKLEWLDFVSYDPRFTAKPLYIYRVHRADVDVTGVLAELVKFWGKIEKYYQQVIL